MAKLIAILLLCSVSCVFQTEAASGRLTHYCSYAPCCRTPGITYTEAEKQSCGQDECDDYNACQWSGQFAYPPYSLTHDQVISTNIVSFFSTHGDSAKYANKKLRVTQNGRSIDVTVQDTCGDSDCNGCCTDNAGSTGYLVDFEANTYVKSGFKDGTVSWVCLNC